MLYTSGTMALELHGLKSLKWLWVSMEDATLKEEEFFSGWGILWEGGASNILCESRVISHVGPTSLCGIL